ncbi:amino acid adenylation domain-containing protein [Kribbella sp. NPDC056861]|uniref:amino acid adenylation domain-containing protein n=1 Tax=Kribbella sp. NPDC056861 TaxID=3154857 RepID=UPI003419BD53
MTAAGAVPRIGFLFPGQSSEYAGMAVELYRDQPVFRAAIDRHTDTFRRLTGVGPLDVFADADAQTRAELLQPAVFLLQVSLAEFWISCGVTPAAVIGHSLGEYAAACVAGVFDVEQGLELVSARGNSFAAVPSAGRMVAVACPDLAELEQLVATQGDAAAVAAYNGPERATVSGTDDAIAELESVFGQRGWATIPLQTTHAFHSTLVAPAVPALAAAAGGITHQPPTVPMVLNLTGAWATSADLGAEYWSRQLTSPVRFVSGLRRLLDSGCTVFVEVGAGRALTAAGRTQASGAEVWLPGLSARNPDQDTVLDHLDRLEEAGVPIVPPVDGSETAEPAQTEYPLSYAQRSLVMLHQMNPDSASYNVAFTARFTDGFDSATLHRAVQSLVARHSALRTTFSRVGTGGSDGRQIVHGHLEPDFADVDARHWTEEQLDEAVRTAHREPFDLASGPLVRVRVYQVAPGEAVVLLTLHHVVCDFWSLGILVAELEQLYLADTEGRSAELSERNVPYSDFVTQQTEQLASRRGVRARTYWHEQLSGRLEPTEWPRFDLDPAPADEGGSIVFAIPDELAEGVVALAKAEGVTPYVVLLTAYQLLVSRYSGQRDVLVGAPVAGRTGRAMADSVGNFVNPVVIRADLTAAESFREQLGHNRRTVLEALEHQSYPFELLVSELAPQRVDNRNPVFQAMFNYLKSSKYPAHAGLYVADEGAAAVDWAGLTASPYRLVQQEDQLELGLEIVHDGDRLVGLLKHRTSVFSAAAAQRMTEHYLTLLRAAVDGPGRSVAELPLLAGVDDDLNRHATTVPVEPDDSLAIRFRRTAEQHPDRVAVRCAGDQLTYAELDELAGRWTARLRAEGVGPGSRVALLLEPSIDTVVAIVATQRAGAAYVVLDASYPAARCQMVLEDSESRVVLTQPELVGVLGDAAVPVLVMPETDLPPAGEPGDLPSAGDVAYTVYTSGSTGTPKGIDVEHGNVLSLIEAMREYVVMDETAVGALFHSTGFDLSVWELWGTLLAGGRLVVVPSGSARSPDLFHALLVEEQVTHIVQTPSALHGLAAVVGQNGPAGLALQHVFSCGEQLPAPLARVAREWCGTLWNMYGPAETTVWVTAQAIRAEDCAGTGVPVGLPLANSRTYVLDEQGRQVPPEFSGELYVGGQCVARGYVNRPELTKERFLDSPFEPDGRLYRTGDLARVNSQGILEVLGRVDNQVKINGFRIELEEVEAQLDKVPGVRRSTALVVGAGVADRRLVACVIPEAGQQPVENELKATLRTSLPPYMVPTAIGFFDAFPLNASQKVDRQQLAEQFAKTVTRTDSGPVVTLSAQERRVAALWQEVLLRRGIGRDDNFFDLGGTSMLLMQVHQQLVAGEPSLKVSELFRYPTVASLAARLTRVPAEPVADGTGVVRTASRPAPVADDTVRGARLRARGRGGKNV